MFFDRNNMSQFMWHKHNMSKTRPASAKANIGINLALSTDYWYSSWASVGGRESVGIWPYRFSRSLHIFDVEKCNEKGWKVSFQITLVNKPHSNFVVQHHLKPILSALEMKELISKHFKTVNELMEWSENVFEKVIHKLRNVIWGINICSQIQNNGYNL